MNQETRKAMKQAAAEYIKAAQEAHAAIMAAQQKQNQAKKDFNQAIQTAINAEATVQDKNSYFLAWPETITATIDRETYILETDEDGNPAKYYSTI